MPHHVEHVHSHPASQDADRATPHAQQEGVAALRRMIARGLPPPRHVAALIERHPGERDAMMALLHHHVGSRYVRRVVHAVTSPAHEEPAPVQHTAPAQEIAPTQQIAPVQEAPAQDAKVAEPVAQDVAKPQAAPVTVTFAIPNVAADYEAAAAQLSARDRQRIEAAMQVAVDFVGSYQAMDPVALRTYAFDYLKYVLTASLKRGDDIEALVAMLSTAGFAQSIAVGYDRAYYEAREKADPEFARMQREMRAGNAAQTRNLADQMG